MLRLSRNIAAEPAAKMKTPPIIQADVLLLATVVPGEFARRSTGLAEAFGGGRPTAACRATSPAGAGRDFAVVKSIVAEAEVELTAQRKPSVPVVVASVVKVAAQADFPSSADASARSRRSRRVSGGLRRATLAGPEALMSQAAFAPVPVSSRQATAGVRGVCVSSWSGRSSPSSHVGGPDHSSSQPFQRPAMAAGGGSIVASSSEKMR